MCKAVARRAELPEDDFWLHKFRATFATRALAFGRRPADGTDVDGAQRSGEHDALPEAKPGESGTGEGQRYV